MAAVIPLIYLIFLGFFLISSLVIAYHIWNFTLSRSEAVMTLTIFVVGLGVLLAINGVLYLAIDWPSIFVDTGNIKFIP